MPHLRDRVGRKRNQFLLVCSMVYIGIGLSFLAGVPSPVRSAMFLWLPGASAKLSPFLGWVWIAAAVIAIGSVVFVRPAHSDGIAFGVLTAIPLAFALLFSVTWIAGYSETAWVSAVVYFGYALIVMLVSSWAEPTYTPVDLLVPPRLQPPP